jgi:hypothetical protein
MQPNQQGVDAAEQLIQGRRMRRNQNGLTNDEPLEVLGCQSSDLPLQQHGLSR